MRLTKDQRDYYLTLLPMAWAENTPQMRRFKKRMARRQPLLYACLRALAEGSVIDVFDTSEFRVQIHPGRAHDE